MSMVPLGGIPTLASFTGTVGNEALLNSINAELGGSNFFNSFNDILSEGRRLFTKYAVEPVRMVGNTFKRLAGMLNHDEVYIPITSEDMLPKIPICMHNGILTYAPIRKLFDEGRIFGFGYQHIPEEGDQYGRQIANGYIPDVMEAMDEDGDVEFVYEFCSTDVELTFEEIESLEETREYLDTILRDTQIDPTDPLLNDRG